MPFVRQKIDPDWLPWVTKLAGCYRDAYGGDWAIDAERNAVFFFEGADALDPTLPGHYRLKVGTDVFAVEILDSERSPVLQAMNQRGGIAKIWISECLGAVTPREEVKQLCIEGYRCLHRSPTENFRTVSSWDRASDFGIRPAADNFTAEGREVMKKVLKDYPDVLRVILGDKK